MTALTLYPDRPPHGPATTLTDRATIAAALAPFGVELEHWHAGATLPANPSDADILTAYADDVARLRLRGYPTVDVIRLTPDNPKREELRAKFLSEHIHGEDEVRFFVEGAGLFYIRAEGTVHALECTQGDLIVLPAGTRHWFDTGERPFFTAIRLFTTPEGWVGDFTGDRIADSIPRYAGIA